MQNSQGRTQGKPARGNALESRVAGQPALPGSRAPRRSQRGLLRGFFLASAIAVTASAAKGQLSTQDHLSEPGFWPTQGQASRAEFVGAQVCARCHAMKTATQKETPMAKNLALAQDAEVLRAHPALAFSSNQFEYRIDTDQKQSTFSIAGEGQRLSYPLLWAFGTGRLAQSYLFKQQDGNFYEARASYFTSLHNLAFTPARALASATGIQQAMYRPVPMDEVRRCFACHATAANVGGVFDEQHLIPGVGCEACHGPGAGHVKLMDKRAANGSGAGKSAIFNPGDLLAGDAVDFCGACHGTWWDTKLSGIKGASSARSAPYRLVTSKCWGTGDARLACAACHDPHRQLQTDASDYDPICLSCHVSRTGEKPTSSHPGAACPKATRKCTDCHMEKVYVPEMHANFTDHRIRISHPGEPFPE